jgi:hypothetical protein
MWKKPLEKTFNGLRARQEPSRGGYLRLAVRGDRHDLKLRVYVLAVADGHGYFRPA